MKQQDWYGIGTSAAIHLLLAVLFGFMSAGEPHSQTLGYVEVELGPFADGQPVQLAEDEGQDRNDPSDVPVETESEPTEDPEPEPQPPTTSPEETRPVDLPDQLELVRDEEQVETSDAETIAPDQPSQQDEEVQPEPEAQAGTTDATSGGSPEGESGAAEGDEGEADDAEKSAPFAIEGLDRDLLSGPTPRYDEQVNATIQVRITVDPQGRVVQRIPLMKANPRLEQAAMEALGRWRFNALPPGAPQEPQTGVVTFHFRLE